LDKFGRSYSLLVKTLLGDIAIEPPFTVDFDIQRDILSSCNAAKIRVYNLSEKIRNQIYHDMYDYDNLTKSIELKAGYGSSLPTVCKGNISSAWSAREGVNFITQMESFDGWDAVVNSYTDMSFPASMPKQAVIESLVTSLASEGIGRGHIGTFSGNLTRGNSSSLSTMQLLQELTSGGSPSGVFIDNNNIHCLKDDECYLGEIAEIDSSSGLIGTPIRSEKGLHFDMVFEPRLSIGQLIALNSSTGKIFNGKYKVVSVHHRGMISESVCGEVITTVGLFYGANALTLVA
jgi:hypothetical protein